MTDHPGDAPMTVSHPARPPSTPTLAPSDPAADAHLLAADLRMVMGALRRRLREESRSGDLTPSQMSVVRRLKREGPATVTRLAHAEGVRPQSMGATVASLESAGLLTGEPHPTDGRQTVLSLTPACQALIVAGRAAREDWLFRAIRRTLAVDEQVTLANGIALLQRLLDGPDGPDGPDAPDAPDATNVSTVTDVASAAPSPSLSPAPDRDAHADKGEGR